jgi:S-DNA-T family DNA segregation ATPase FtsK/SpoIIIE
MTDKSIDERISSLEKRVEALEKMLSHKRAAVEDVASWDPLIEEAWSVVKNSNNASASFLQRKLKIGYARAARILDQLEIHKVVGPNNGAKGREVYVEKEFDLSRE